MTSYGASRAFIERASRVTPAGVHSNFRLGPNPLAYQRAVGSRLWDIDGNEYIDYALGMGPGILGHAPPTVLDAVARTLADGQLFGGQHPAELELSERLCAIVPCAERVRLSLTGTEALQTALRLARAHTGRDVIVKFEGHYDGWSDPLFVSVNPGPDRGPAAAPETVPATVGQDPGAYASTVVAPWNDSAAFDAIVSARPGRIAAVVMEPILCNTAVIPPAAGFLEAVRARCTAEGIVLVFDEVITGFRVGLTGAQGLLGVTPDLAVFAKAMAGGFPISCVAGRADLFERVGTGEVMHGGTYNSNVISCVAALATLDELEKGDGAAYQSMSELGSLLMDGLRAMGVHVQGLPTVFHTSFGAGDIVDYRSYLQRDLARQAAFVDALADRGVRSTPRGTWFLSSAHTAEDIEQTLRSAEQALDT